jgi:hypothetical protein
MKNCPVTSDKATFTHDEFNMNDSKAKTCDSPMNQDFKDLEHCKPNSNYPYINAF